MAVIILALLCNPKRRLIEHNSGKSPYTSKKRPWKIVYAEKFGNKTEALKREKFLKRQRNKSFYERLTKEFKKNMV
jgi:putative endonuclease